MSGIVSFWQTSSISPVPNITFGFHKPQIVGFLPYWLLTKANKAYEKYLTNLTYFGLTVDAEGKLVKRVNPAEQEPGWTALNGDKVAARFADAKRKNLKTSLLVISGDEAVVGQMINDPEISANNLIADAVPIMKEHGFTDLNLDIEVFMDASASARQNFTKFTQAVKDGLVRQKAGTLSIDLIPISLVKEKLYDAKALGEIADTVILMTYDYHYLGGMTTGAVAPIGGAGVSVEFDVETAVQEALKVIPKEKILLGIPLYGYSWETIVNMPESATIPGGAATASTRKVAEILAGCASCSAQFDPVAKEPYLIYPEGDVFKQIYYENESSMKEKILLAQKYKLGGIALWAIGYEDDMILNPLVSYKQSLTSPWSD